MSAIHPAGAEEVGAFPRAAGNLDLDGLFRQAELPRDLFLGDALQFSEDEDLAAAGRQRVDGLKQNADFLVGADGFRDIDAFLYDAHGWEFSYRLVGEDLRASENAQRDVSRSGEEVRFCALDPGRFRDLEDASIAFLHKVIDIVHVRETTPQVSAESGFVWLDFLGKPPGLFWGRGLHRGRGCRRSVAIPPGTQVMSEANHE